jgi:hypothetical protein
MYVRKEVTVVERKGRPGAIYLFDDPSEGAEERRSARAKEVVFFLF